MLRGGIAGALAVLGATLAGPVASALACSLAAPQRHTLDPAEQATDTTAPMVPQISNVVLKRGRGPDQGCGGGSASSCDDLGFITFHVAASDDRTPSAQIGYRITVDGVVADSLLGTEDTLRADAEGSIMLVWIDGATNEQDDLSFDLQVRAVDLAGNLSATAVVPIRDQGNTACGIAGRSSSGRGVAVAVVALALAVRRRGRGVQRRFV